MRSIFDIPDDNSISLDLIKYQLKRYVIENINPAFEISPYEIQLLGEEYINESNWKILHIFQCGLKLVICTRRYLLSHFKDYRPILDYSSERYKFLTIKQLMEYQ